MATPEKLSIWDRLFNRYKKTIHKKGSDKWFRTNSLGYRIEGSDYSRDYVEYLITDRFTGSETIKREYLN